MFACKNCGGNVKFDIKSGQLACEYCHSLFDPYAYEDKTSDAEVQKDFEATIFTCPQCGGEILSTDDTAAGFCSFCGASTVLYSRMQKEHKPAYIIPFAKSKDDCKQAYMSLMKKAIFAPKELKDPKFIDGFRGIYMPYWTYYVTQKAPISLPAKDPTVQEITSLQTISGSREISTPTTKACPTMHHHPLMTASAKNSRLMM